MLQNTIIQILSNCLNLGDRSVALETSSPLIGAMPELDSIAVVGIIAALEDHFEITIYDDEITAESFQTVGTLVAFVDHKLHEQ